MKYIIFVILLTLGAILIDVESTYMVVSIFADAAGIILILFAGDYIQTELKKEEYTN